MTLSRSEPRSAEASALSWLPRPGASAAAAAARLCRSTTTACRWSDRQRFTTAVWR
jgi:transposase